MTESHTRKRKALLTLAAAGIAVTLVVLGTFAAFVATTANTGNQISSGTVKIDDDSGTTTALYDYSDQAPGASYQKCLRIKFNGTLASSVRLYTSAGITDGSNYDLTVERGSGLTTVDGTRSCAGFTATSTAYATAPLSSFPTSYSGPGLDGKAAGVAWAQNDTVDYRFTITVKDDPTPNAHTTANSTGAHSFTWEARSN